MNGSGRLRLIGTVALFWGACSNSNSPTSPWWDQPTNQAPLAVTALTFSPPALEGGGAGQGTVTVGAAAGVGGARIALSSNVGAAVVPAVVVVPAGAKSATFTVVTSSVAEDAFVSITASLSGKSRTALLPVWTQAENSFWFATDPDAYFVQMKHYTTSNARFEAYCSQNGVSLTTRGSDGTVGSASFQAGGTAPLTVGSYETGPWPSPSMFVSVEGALCNFSARRFVLHEVDLTATGFVRRLVATFEERCQGFSGGHYGKVVLTNAPKGSSISTCFQ